MAGLVAATRARELGLDVVVHEKGDRAGGSMLLSSCVVWRHRDFGDFRSECPDGDARLQRRVYEELDDALDWLESLGVPVVARDTGNPLTTGRRFDAAALTDALARVAGDVRVRSAFSDHDFPLLLATGGYAARMARERGLALRANPWSGGDAVDFAVRHGASVTRGMDQFYGRAFPYPATIAERDYVRAAQLYGRLAHVVGDDGTPIFPREPAWHENDLVQEIARRPGGRAWYVVDANALAHETRYGSVADVIARAESLGGEVRRAEALEDLGLGAVESPKLTRPPFAAVRVQAAVTHTIGGLRIDERAHVLRDDGASIDGLYAAGADAGGFFTGGYASGLAAALVFGRVAAATAAEEAK